MILNLEKEIYIEFDRVEKSFKEIKAVENLSFKVYKGDIYGFLGPNGAGKSTSIRMLLSLIRVDKGTIRLFGKNLSVNRYQSLSRIGALIEKPDFYKYLTARKNLEILARISNVQNYRDKVEEVLELVGLSGRADSKVKTFSQGMRQRLGIAQTLLHDPDLIILDEPANGLDPQGQMEIRELIKSLNVEKKITLLMSSHLLSEIEEICNRMIIIDKGTKIVEGEVADLLSSENLNVVIKVDDLSYLKTVLQNSIWQNKITNCENQNCFFNLKNNEIPELVRFLIEKNVNIYSVKPLRSLEEYFIRLTT